MAPREDLSPALSDGRRRIARRIAGAYFLFAATWIAVSDLALLELTKDLPAFAGGSLIKGGVFVSITTALLYLLVSHYLQRNPDASTVAVQPAERAAGRFAPAILFGVVALLAITLVVIMFSYESGQDREAARRKLQAILELKADQVELLLEHRRVTARSYARARGLRHDLEQFAGRSDPDIESEITERIEFLRRDLDFDAVLALDAAGRMRAATGPLELRQISPDLAAIAARSMATGTSVSHFLHRSDVAPGAPIIFDYVTPLSGDSPRAGNVGALVLRERARGRLFRVVENWPTPSPTAETLLVRQDGNDVLYLNDVRHEKDSAFRLRRPLGQTDLVAVKAIGTPGPLLSDGVDYRGVAVVGASRPIAGTDWFMIAKVDRDEVLAPVRRSASIWLASILCMTLFAAVGVLLMWRQQLRVAALHRRSGKLERLALVKHFDFLSKYANDFIFLIDAAGRIVEVNDRVTEMYQRSREELIGRSVFELRASGHEVTGAEKDRILGLDRGRIFETVHQRRDGSTFPVEISNRAIQVEGKRYVQGIVRDITERKKAEAHIERLIHVRNALSEVNRAIVHAENEEALFADICAIGVRHAGFVLAWIGIPDMDSGNVLPLTSAGGPAALDYLGRLKMSYRDAPEGRGPAGTAVREGHAVVSNEFLGDARNAPWHEIARAANIQACAAFPLRRGDEIMAVLVVYSKMSGYFDAEILALLDEMVQDVSFSLDVLENNRKRKQAEEAVAQLAAIVEYSFDAIISRGLDRIIRSWNPAAERLFGWKAQEVIGRSIALLIPPEREDESVRNRALSVHGEGIPAYDTVRLTKDGRRIDVSLTHSVIRNANGEVTGVSLVFRDISEQIKAEQAQKRLAAIVASSSDAIISRDMDGKIQSWNAAAERMFGWSEQDAVGQPIALIVPPERRGEVRPLIERVISGEDIGVVESSHRRKDGTRIDTATTFSAIRNVDGDVTAVSIIYRDITEHKKAIEALRENDARFRALIEQSISGISIVQGGVITYANPRLAEIFGYADAGELIGRDPLETIAPRERAAHARSIRRVISGEARSEATSFTGLCKDGREIVVGVHAASATYEGKPAIIAILQDISERKRAEEEIQRYIARLKQATQSTINVVATIGELRDPYTHGHERRVGEIAAAIAVEMGLDENRVEGIRIAGYLHDVGKIGVPAEILAKPGRLTKAEYDLVKDHAQQSYDILKTVEFPWPIAQTAWQHHERLDGSGYPRGLKGDEIILEARILAVADVVEAMSSHRPYRAGLGLEKALAEVEKHRGRLYDPQAADACLRLFRGKSYVIPA